VINGNLVLRHHSAMGEMDSPFSLPGFRNESNEVIPYVSPSSESVQKKHLEWSIPDSPHNRRVIQENYSPFMIVGEEVVKEEPVPEEEEEPVPEEVVEDNEVVEDKGDPEKATPDPSQDGWCILPIPGPGQTGDPSQDVDYYITPEDPEDVKLLKAAIAEKLTGMGVDIPHNSRLSTLQDLLKKTEG
jgi:hypothetical protein